MRVYEIKVCGLVVGQIELTREEVNTLIADSEVTITEV